MHERRVPERDHPGVGQRIGADDSDRRERARGHGDRVSPLGRASSLDALGFLLDRPFLDVLHAPRLADLQREGDDSPGGWRDLARDLAVEGFPGEAEIVHAIEDFTRAGGHDVMRYTREILHALYTPGERAGS